MSAPYSYLLDLLGIRYVKSGGVAVPQSRTMNFTGGISASYNASTGAIDVSGGVENNTYDTLRAKTPVAGQVHFVTERGGGMFAAVTGAAPATYVDDDATVIIPAGGDGSSAFLRIYTGSIWCEWLGAVAGERTVNANASVNTAAINAAIELAKSIGADVQIGAGHFWIDDTILIDSCSGLKFTGAGSSNANGQETATIFMWGGPNDRAAVQLQDSRECQLRDFGVELFGGTFPLLTGLRLYYAGVGPVMQRNEAHNIWVSGHSGYCGSAIIIDKSVTAGDSNNSENGFYNVVGTQLGDAGGVYAISAGVQVLHSQAKTNQFVQCGFFGETTGARPMDYAYYGHGSLTWINGISTYAGLADFGITGPNDSLSILTHNSEDGVRLMTHGGGTAIGRAKLANVRFDTTRLHADGEFIQWGCGGSLSLEEPEIQLAEKDCFVAVSSQAPTHIKIEGGVIHSLTHPLKISSTARAQTRVEFRGVSRRVGGGSAEMWPDIEHTSSGARIECGIGTRRQAAGGLVRPSSPMPREEFFDEYLGRIIYWDAFATEWVTGEGASAAAAYTPDLAGTLVAAWHFDSGVTEASDLVSAVTAKFGTSAGLAQATGTLQPELVLLNSGHYGVRGLDASDFLEATLAVPLAQECWIYVVGEYANTTAGGIVVATGADRLNIGVNSDNQPYFSAPTVLTAGDALPLSKGRSFALRGHANGASSELRGDIDARGVSTGSGDIGTDDGDTAFRIGAYSGDGALHAVSMVLLYTTAPDETYLRQYLREWGRVTIV